MLSDKFAIIAVLIFAVSSNSTHAQSPPKLDPANTGLVVLDYVEWSQSVRDAHFEDAQRLLISVPHPFRLGESESIYYSLRSVPSEDLDDTMRRLSSLSQSRFYNCHLDEKPKVRICHYFRSIDLSAGRFIQSLEDVHYKEMSDEQREVFEWGRNLSLEEVSDSTNHPNFSTWRHLQFSQVIIHDDGTEITETYLPELSFQYGETANNSIKFPLDWYKVFVTEKPKQLWVECSVRVDSSGFPIKDPNFECPPVAILSERGLYLAIQRRQPPVGGGYFIARVSGQAFNIANVNQPEEAAARIMELFTEKLIQRLSAPPISAKLDRSEILPPRQFLFRRDFQPSLVLNTGFRGPYFERSAYLFQWWCGQVLNGYTDPLSDCRSFSPGILITLHHSLQISSDHSGDYPDGSPQQQFEYQKIIEKAIDDTIKDTTTSLGGVMHNNIGVFTGEVQ